VPRPDPTKSQRAEQDSDLLLSNFTLAGRQEWDLALQKGMQSHRTKQLNLQDIELVTKAGQSVHLAYEKVGDVLEIVFQGVTATSAIELTDNILLSFNRELPCS
jgi:hypothetical protein